jgi:hypothetical protein
VNTARLTSRLLGLLRLARPHCLCQLIRAWQPGTRCLEWRSLRGLVLRSRAGLAARGRRLAQRTWYCSRLVSSGSASCTTGASSAEIMRHMLAAVATAVRCTLVGKKSR